MAENKGDYFDAFERLLEINLAIPANEPIVCFCKNACDSAIASHSVWGAGGIELLKYGALSV